MNFKGTHSVRSPNFWEPISTPAPSAQLRWFQSPRARLSLLAGAMLATLSLAEPKLLAQHGITVQLDHPRAVHVGDPVIVQAAVVNTDFSGDDWIITNIFITLFSPVQPIPAGCSTRIIPIPVPGATNVVLVDPCFGTTTTVLGLRIHFEDFFYAVTNFTAPDCDGAYSILPTKLSVIGIDTMSDTSPDCPVGELVYTSPDQIFVLRPCIACTSFCSTTGDDTNAIITSTGSVSNCGNIALTNVIVIADKPAPGTIVASFGTNVLFPNTSFVFSNAYPASLGPNVDTITVSGTEQNLNQPVVETVSHSCSSTCNFPPVAHTNSPPSVTCPNNTSTECAALTTFSAVVSDVDADDLTVVWTVNGARMQTNAVAGTTNATGTTVSFAAVLPLGTNLVAVIVSDGATNSVSCTATAAVVDTKPPVIHSLRAEPDVLWPPNHRMVPVNLLVNAADNCDASPAVRIISITSNEPEDPLAPDWEIRGPKSLTLRAERLGKGQGRIYTIVVQCEDTSGNVSTASVDVTVPHN